jgi:cysteinyl-tRNA synthetase
MGRIAIVVDGSVEAVGDPYAPIEEALADAGVGICGPVGAVTRDLRSFEEDPGPEVDAIEGYLMAVRRELLGEVSFDRGYRFYRWADVDLSFQVRALGLRAERVDVPVRLHEHRGWAALEPEERWRLSKRNHAGFLRRFGGRTDLLVSPPT